MKVALTGYTNSGRSTIFRAVCDSFTESSIDKGRLRVKLGSAKIPDHRLNKIAEIYQSAKITESEMFFNDFEYTQDDSVERKGLDDQMVSHLKQTDALIYVVRGFVDENVYYRFDKIDPLRDAQELESDMIITDLASAEKRLTRIEIDLEKGKKVLQPEWDLLYRIRDSLDSETPLRKIEFTRDEEKFLRGFGFLTQKNAIILVNTEDDGSYPGDEKSLLNWAQDKGMSVLTLRGKLQSEMLELDEKDRESFQKEMGIEEAALIKLIKAVYKSVGLIHFFTGGDTEAHCWPVRKGSTAQEAAGVIHTDLQERFIRAEVMSYEDLVKCGSEKACKDAGVYRAEKKDYIVKDGDVIFFRHN